MGNQKATMDLSGLKPLTKDQFDSNNPIEPPPRPERTTLADLERLVSGNNANGVIMPASTRAPRRRFMFRFWLDDNKPLESELGKELDTLKNKRKFLPTVRDALRLYFSLLKGETALLKDMFPMIVT